MSDGPTAASATIRSLAAEARLRVDEVVGKLAALGVRHGNQKLEGRELRDARPVLGLPAYRGPRCTSQIAVSRATN